MNLAYFGRYKGVQSWSQTKKYHFCPVLDSQSRGPVFKTTGWLQGWLSLSSFWGVLGISGNLVVKRGHKVFFCFLVSSTILAVLQGTENLAYVFIPKGENQIKCPTLFPGLLWSCALMQKHKFYRKNENLHNSHS